MKDYGGMPATYRQRNYLFWLHLAVLGVKKSYLHEELTVSEAKELIDDLKAKKVQLVPKEQKEVEGKNEESKEIEGTVKKGKLPYEMRCFEFFEEPYIPANITFAGKYKVIMASRCKDDMGFRMQYRFSTFESAEKYARKTHKQIVKNAIENGKRVPNRVLIEYPNLKQTYVFKCKDEDFETQGKPVIIKGFEDFEFFIGKNKYDCWCVAEAKTGLTVTDSHDTQAEAIEKAQSRFDKYHLEDGKPSVCKKINEGVKQYYSKYPFFNENVKDDLRKRIQAGERLLQVYKSKGNAYECEARCVERRLKELKAQTGKDAFLNYLDYLETKLNNLE